MSKIRVGVSCKDISKFDECLKVIEKNHLSHIELQVNSIEEDSFIYSEKDIDSICSKCKALGITVSIHSFTGINLSEKITRLRREIIKITKEIIDIAEYMCGTYVVLHLGNAGFRYDSAKKSVRLDYAINSINELEEYSKNMKTNIAIENIDRLVSDTKCYIGDCYEDFKYIFERLDYPGTGIIFDIGHVNLLSGADLVARQFLNKFHNNILAVHLHTNNGIIDQHVGIGQKWFEKYGKCMELFEKLVVLENYSISEMEKSLKYINLFVSGK